MTQRTRVWYKAWAPDPKRTRFVAKAEMEGRDWMNSAEAEDGVSFVCPYSKKVRLTTRIS